MDDAEKNLLHALLDAMYLQKDHQSLRKYSAANYPEDIRAHAAGLLMRPWLPWRARRQLIMFVLLALVILGAMELQSYWILVLLVIPLSFSPRVVGETLAFFSNVSRNQ